MTVPIILLVIPIVSAALAYFLRRWHLVTPVIGSLTILILFGAVLVTAPVRVNGQSISSEGLLPYSWNFLGISMLMTAQIRAALIVIYIGFGLLFLLTIFYNQDQFFTPVSLTLLSPLASLLLVRPTILGGAILLVIAAVLAVLIQGDRIGSTVASIRYLTLMALAGSLLLCVGWMSNEGQIQLLSPIIYSLSVALLIILAAFPFFFWVPAVVNRSSSFVPIIVFGLATIVFAVFFVMLLAVVPVIYANSLFLSILRASGLMTVIIAGILILISKRVSRLLTSLLLLDIGNTTIAFSLGGRVGIQTILLFVLLRTLSLVLACIGSELLQTSLKFSPGKGTGASRYRGIARQKPLGFALFVYGGLSLAGVPLTPGFAGRWLVINTTSNSNLFLTAVLVISIVLGFVGILRMFRLALNQPSEPLPETRIELNKQRIIEGLLLAGSMIIALFPGLFTFVSQILANPY